MKKKANIYQYTKQNTEKAVTKKNTPEVVEEQPRVRWDWGWCSSVVPGVARGGFSYLGC